MRELLPRERVLTALRHEEPDRLPLDFWSVPEIWARLVEHFRARDGETVLARLGVDVRSVAPEYVGPKQPVFSDGSYRLANGTVRRMVANRYGSYEEFASYPLADCRTVKDVDEFAWERVDWWDLDGFSEKIGDLHETYYTKIETGGLFELAWGLRGYELYLTDLLLRPELAHRIIERITDYYCAFIEKALAEAGDKIDMVYTYDDIAGQEGLLVSPDLWDVFIRPCHEKLNRTIKRFGKTIMYHSCGAVEPMIERLAMLPIDVLNPIQPLAKGMGLKRIKESYGASLCFHGGIDIQELLPFGTEENIRRTVRETAGILGRRGGYILSAAHYIQADTPVENVLALYDEAASFRYGS